MHYFHTFGFIEETWNMALGFLVVSIAATLVESHPISTELDDNLTIPLTSFLVGSLIFWCLASKGSWDVFLYHVLTCKRLRTVVNCENCTLSMVNIFSVVSVAATLVELHPIRTELIALFSWWKGRAASVFLKKNQNRTGLLFDCSFNIIPSW